MNDAKKLPLLHDTPQESMLTYAVLLGQQQRKNDPYALGSQIVDLTLRGGFSIHESAYNDPDLQLQPLSDVAIFEEETVLTEILRRNCPPDKEGRLRLSTVLASKPFLNDMQILWKRVVMMYHADHNKDRPLYDTDPTRLMKWQRFRRTLGWTLAIGAVYAEPGLQGRLGGLDQVQKGYADQELIGNTAAGNRLCRAVLNLRRHMLQRAESGPVDPKNTADYERALPYAFLFDDILAVKWPVFLSQHYTHYPAWFTPAQAVEDVTGRQQHIAATLRIIGSPCFPARKRRAHPV